MLTEYIDMDFGFPGAGVQLNLGFQSILCSMQGISCQSRSER